MNLYPRVVRMGHLAYKATLSPWIGRQCRYLPTCSDYAAEALILHGPWRGGWLAARRLCRCHPLGGSGFDPVPPAERRENDRTDVSRRRLAPLRRWRERR